MNDFRGLLQRLGRWPPPRTGQGVLVRRTHELADLRRPAARFGNVAGWNGRLQLQLWSRAAVGVAGTVRQTRSSRDTPKRKRPGL